MLARGSCAGSTLVAQYTTTSRPSSFAFPLGRCGLQQVQLRFFSDEPYWRRPSVLSGAGNNSSARNSAGAPNTTTKSLSKVGEPPRFQSILSLPISRKPLFPGQRMPIWVRNPKVVEEINRLIQSQTPYLGLFLRKDPAEIAGSGGTTAAAGGSSSSTASDHAESADQEGSTTTRGSSAFDEEIVTNTNQLYEVGTLASIQQVMPLQATGGLQIQVTGHRRITLKQIENFGPPLHTNVVHWSKNAEHGTPGAASSSSSGSLSTKDGDTAKNSAAEQENEQMSRALVQETIKLIQDIFRLNPQFREFLEFAMQSPTFKSDHQNPGRLADFASAMTSGTKEETMQVFQEPNGVKRLQLAYQLLQKELQVIEAQVKIRSQVEETVQKQQKDFYLREQLKVIKKELGMEKDDKDALAIKFKDRIKDRKIPEEIKEVIDAELDKLSFLDKNSSEFQVARNYLDWLTVLPFDLQSKENFSLSKARTVLDRDHYGLQDVKDRILEFIGVGKLKGSVQGKIICLVGPPGTGKTSIGKSIAESLNREFFRFSVGGLHDVAEIKGHRRTYIGAMPGKLIQCLKQTKVNNPLILIDEIDKLGRGGMHGDPSSALLEVLDPSQNGTFVDHFLDVPVDFSQVLFLCTANVLDTIPEPLLDRMEVVRLSGYDLPEKTEIAKNYLIPKVMEQSGLKGKDEISFISNDAVDSVIRWYCREAGVRNLQKQIEKLCRKRAFQRAEIADKLEVAEAKRAEEEKAKLLAEETRKKEEEAKIAAADGNAEVDSSVSTTSTTDSGPASTTSSETSKTEISIEEATGDLTITPGESSSTTTSTSQASISNEQASDHAENGPAIAGTTTESTTTISPETSSSSASFPASTTEPEATTTAKTGTDSTTTDEKTSSTSLTTEAGEQVPSTSAPTETVNAADAPVKPLPTITAENLSDYLGKPLYTSDKLYETPPAGVVMGLAWTALGGSTLYIETKAIETADSGRGSLNVTGRLGDVMQESSKISMVVAKKFHPAVIEFARKHDIYLHVPEGATPKDGPSAGITMTTAIISLALNKSILPNIAMTGEVSLTGMVLPVGGIKEKTIAARRSACEKLIFPEGNRRDVDALPAYLKENIEIFYAKEYDDVWKIAFGESELPCRVVPPAAPVVEDGSAATTASEDTAGAATTSGATASRPSVTIPESDVVEDVDDNSSTNKVRMLQQVKEE
ncbi:unnamed protein product [Amoebophrya sp. A120]|nr:unnamed protein product [Amoebophrya sp. A120]|eukprot:GSA120T00012048001.1